MAGTQLIDGKRETIFLVDPKDVVIIGHDTEDGPEHYLYDERVTLPLDPAMVLNIAAIGVREPVYVTVEGRGDTKRVLCVDGRRRILHARAANEKLAEQGEPLISVPVRAEKGMSEKEAMDVSVSLNEIRVQDPVMVKVAKAARMKARGHSQAEIARAFGVDPQTVWMWLRIDTLSDSVKKEIGVTIGASSAARLADLSKEEQVTELKRLKEEAKAEGKDRVTQDQVEAASRARKQKNESIKAAPSRRTLRYIVENGKDSGLDDAFLAGLAFAMGELNPSRVKGLSALIKKATEKKAKKAKDEGDSAEAAE